MNGVEGNVEALGTQMHPCLPAGKHGSVYRWGKWIMVVAQKQHVMFPVHLTNWFSEDWSRDCCIYELAWLNPHIFSHFEWWLSKSMLRIVYVERLKVKCINVCIKCHTKANPNVFASVLKVYAVGGYDGQSRLSSVECYDSFSNRWTEVAPMKEAVSSPAVASCAGKLFVIGGGPDDETCSDKVCSRCVCSLSHIL